jgi:hypothetical protein
MATQVTVFNPSAVARPSFAIKGELSAIAKALAGSGGGGKRISIKGGAFRLLDNGKEITSIDERFLDVVICNAAPKVSRTFYMGKYKEGETTPPACWSADGDLPDGSVKQPQGASCAVCPQNIKGSGQGESRACRYSQRLAVVLANDIDGDVLQLTLPATSLFGKAEGDNRPLQEYVRYHAAQGNDISMMVTRMRFDLAPGVEGIKLVFKAMRWLEDDEYATSVEKGKSLEAISAITMTVSQTDSVPAEKETPALAGPKPKAKPAPKPEPEPEEGEEEEAPPPPPKAKKKPAPMPDDDAPPEPKVKKAAEKPTAPTAGSLADVLDGWDD